jgi:hypothetical protein
MAQNLTYNSLVSDMGAYVEKARIPGSAGYDQIPRIINQAERDIIDELKLQGYEATLRTTLEANKAVVPKPDRWKKTIAIRIVVDGRNHYIYPRSYEYCQVFWPDPTLVGVPKFYADHGRTHWHFAGTPAEAYPLEAKIFQLPRLLGPEQQTNWMTEIAGGALLMRCNKELAFFLKKYDEASAFEAEYGKRITAISATDAQKIMDRAAERDGA